MLQLSSGNFGGNFQNEKRIQFYQGGLIQRTSTPKGGGGVSGLWMKTDKGGGGI